MKPKVKKNLKKILKDALLEYAPGLSMGKELGEGLTSVVYDLPATGDALKIMDTRCATDSDSDRPEDIAARKRMRQYFLNEIATLQNFADCPYIVHASDSYEYVFPQEKRLSEQNRPFRSLFFLRMPKLIALDKYIVSHSTEQTLVQMTADICRAFQCCESQRSIHRDVKPGNIFVREAVRPDDRTRFLLGDFSFCRQLDENDDFSVTRVGTPGFIAPEIAYQVPLRSFNSDIYSLGVTLFYLISPGKFPSDYMDAPGKLRRLSNISPAFANIILRAIQPRPENRYRNAAEMLMDLSALTVSGGESVVGNPYFLQAKQEILRGNFPAAMEAAENGCKQGDRDCKRLLAYCRYHEYRDNPAVVEEVRKALTALSFEENDPTAQYLRAVIHYNDGEYMAYAENLKASAQAGCVIALSKYGRFLFTGELPEIARNPSAGLERLTRAAEEGYLPALIFLKREMKKNPNLTVPASSSLRSYLLNEKSECDDERVRKDMIRFL